MIDIEEVEMQRPQPMFGSRLPSDRPLERWLKVRFPYDAEKIKRVKGIPGALWWATEKCWLVPDAVRMDLMGILKVKP